MMSPYLLLIPILFPVLGAFLLFFLGIPEEKDRQRNRYLETIVVLTSISVWILIFMAEREPVQIYSFISGFSIAFRMDGLAALFAGMVSLMWPLVMLYAFEYMEHSKGKNRFFVFYVMTYGVTLGLAFAANITTLYTFIEMLSLVTIPLVSHYGNHESMFAGRKYAAFTIGGTGLAFFSVVMTTVYGDSGRFVLGGSLNMSQLTPIMEVAFLAGFFGFGVKAAVFPLHSWLPTASVAPTPVTALLHAVAVVNSGVFAITRLVFFTYGVESLMGTVSQTIALLTVVFTMVFAAAMALKQRHFKRRLAYSTVSNLSYMLFGILLMTPHGMTAGLLHMVFHGIIKMSLFLCAGAFIHVTGNEYIYQVNGVGKKMPLTFILYTLAGLSLTGVPLFCGFVSKWNLVTAGIEAGSPQSLSGVFALIISAFLCAMYALSVSVRAIFSTEESDLYLNRPDVKEAGKSMLIPIAFFGILNIVLGVCSQPIVDYLGKIAAGML